MKKLISLILTLILVFSTFSICAVQADTLSEKLTDTSDFSLSSIELTEQMLIGYNIGNCFEMTELRTSYVRPEFSDIDEHIRYKETMAGNVVVTEDFIKYLKSIGIQAIRLPITWFNMLEDENGNIYPKDTWYSSLEVRQEAWYNGTINEEFLARVTQVVDWIIENDMYCIINTHHDAGCNNANSILPIIMSDDKKEQTYNYLTNIWTQVGEHFKDYGSKLLFEFYNEASDSTGSMTPNDTRNAFVSELLTYLIPLIRNQGSNNANRFLVCPGYGGVTFWSDIDGFKDSDTAEDKLIITTHTYDFSSSIGGGVKYARTKMNNLGVGAIIDEIGNLTSGTISEEYLKLSENIRAASDEYKVSCFFWDNGDYDFSILNRYYNSPSTPALAKYVGKDLEYKTYTKEEVINLTASSQPYWIELNTPNAKDVYGKKYMIIASENKIETFDVVKGTAGYYNHSGAEDGLLTYFDSDDGVNYTMRNTIIPTAWCKMAWGTFHVYGSTYKTNQIDGNYELEKIGEGLQNYVPTGINLLELGGEWQSGQYATNGVYAEDSNRICLENIIQVTPGAHYVFTLSDQTKYKFIVRSYDESGNFVSNLGTIDEGTLQAPENAYYFSISMYNSSGNTSSDVLLSFIEDGTLVPTMHLYVDANLSDCEHQAIESSVITVAPTFSAEGYTMFTCDICGGTIKTDIVPTLSESIIIEVQTLEGASIRLNDKTGLRFYTEVDQDTIAQLRADGFTVELGTLIAPRDIVRTQELTFDLSENSFVDVKFESEEFYTSGTFSGIVGSIVNIKETTTTNVDGGNIVRNFVARGYVKVTDTSGNGESKIYYADYENIGRSLGYVSLMLRNDTEEFSKDIYSPFAEKVNFWADRYVIESDPKESDIW